MKHIISNEEHHSREWITSSKMKYFYKYTPYMYHKNYIEKCIPNKVTKSMEFGTLIHQAILEPEIFKNSFLVCDLNKNKTEYKELISDLKKEGRNPTIISSEEMNIIETVCSNFLKDNTIKSLIQNVTIEETISIRDGESGLEIACRGDMRGSNYFIDLKSIDKLLTPNNIKYYLKDFYCKIQAAHYIKIGNIEENRNDFSFYFIMLSLQPPFEICTLHFSKEDLYEYFDINSKILNNISKHLLENKWPRCEELIDYCFL